MRKPFDWWVKWVSSIILMGSMILTSQNIYPYNLAVHSVGITGWLIVAILWNDRALIVVNACSLILLINGLVSYVIKG